MKKFSKIMAAVLTLAMMFSFAGVAAAANHTVSTDSTTHTYQIYQIFTGQYDSTSKQLQDLKYGQNAKTGTAPNSVTATDMAALATIAGKTYANDQERIADLSPYVDLNTTPIAEIGKDKDSSASLAEGYYIIKDTDNSLSDPETYTLYLFKVLNDDLEIKPKSGSTTVDKTVTETNDSTGTTTAGQQGADYDQGDSVPYSIDINLAENVTAYKTYTVTLTDTLDPGLTPPAAANITVTLNDANGDAITGYGAPTVAVNGQTITVTYTVSGANGEAIGDAGAALNNAVINVSYSAVLNEKAVKGEAGNANTYSIEYSNNPNGTDTGTTPDQKVKVYTYEPVIEKTDGNSQPLAGAGFTLYKEVPSTATGAQSGSAIIAGLADGVDSSKLSANKYYVPVAMNEDATSTPIKHTTATTIDAGNYVLIETTVPAGYNAYAGENITITSTIDKAGNLTDLTATPSTMLNVSTSKDLVEGEVVNNSGAVLPATGGMGTTIFYIAGSMMVIGVAVLMVTRRRMNQN